MIVESHTHAQQPSAPPAQPLAPEPIARPAVAAARAGAVRVPLNWYVPCKRVLDVGLALAMLLLAAPLVLICAVLVKLTSRGPAFYSQVRAGRGGKPFTIWKLRSMYHNCEQFSGVVWSKKGDSRITPIGAILRRTHLDELPQLWNVLMGDMSLVGPRPERPEFVPQLDQAVPRYRERMLVLPGVTGLAQIHQGADTDLASVERKLAYDLYYVKTLSFANDTKILFATALHVVWPLAAGKWFFRLTAHGCAESVGMRIRESVN
jgi:lipopolysaccharide/colanic/teichoic acid biosynthesis glycosyltransferase